MLPSGLEMLSKLLPIIPADSASSILHIKDLKLEKERLPAMLLEIMKVLFLFSAPSITKTQMRL